MELNSKHSPYNQWSLNITHTCPMPSCLISVTQHPAGSPGSIHDKSIVRLWFVSNTLNAHFQVRLYKTKFACWILRLRANGVWDKCLRTEVTKMNVYHENAQLVKEIILQSITYCRIFFGLASTLLSIAFKGTSLALGQSYNPIFQCRWRHLDEYGCISHTNPTKIDYMTTKKRITQPCAYFMGYNVWSLFCD